MRRRRGVVLGAALAALAACSSGPEPAPEPAVTLGDVAARAAHTATPLADGRVLVAGGCVVDGCATATRDTFLVAADGRSAATGPAMGVPRTSHAAATLPDGRVAIIGGFMGEGEPVSASVDVFDPETGSVEAAAPLHEARGGHAAAVLADGRVLVVGGWVAPRTTTASSELVDLRHGVVRPAAPLPWSADALDAVALADGRVLVTGGHDGGDGTADAAVYDPATGAWTTVGPMSTPRFKHVSVLLPDGRALVLGGTTDDREILATTELFDPRTGRFTPGPTMAAPRYKLAGGAVALADGRVLVGGGATTVEVLDVGRGTSRPVATPRASGSFTTVTALGRDHYLLLGGYDDHIRLSRQMAVLAPP